MEIREYKVELTNKSARGPAEEEGGLHHDIDEDEEEYLNPDVVD